MFLQKYIQGLTQIMYPLQCWGCGSDAVQATDRICIQCMTHLPQTNFANITDNAVEKIFYGRIPIAAATSLFYFSKNTLLQHLMHQLKYKNNPDVGVYLGKQLGKAMAESNRFNNIDGVIPIPLSKKRQQKRGYNQALAISEGIADYMQIPVYNNLTIRQRDNETQTHKTRQERWENMQNVFKVTNTTQIEDKNILLVDDVITTGATLEACAAELQKIKGTSISIATLAWAIS
jgi:ComF family protein